MNDPQPVRCRKGLLLRAVPGIAAATLAVVGLAACGGGSDGGAAPVGAVSLRVVAQHPHDPAAYTQGLELVDGRLFESTGRYGSSTVREVDPATGSVLASVGLRSDLFGEGLTSLGGGRLVQLTWKAGVATVWRADPLSPVATWEYGGEGWGVCLLHPGTLAMSDGSSTLTFRSTVDFAPTGRVAVTLGGDPVDMLNELECVDGTVWANVWKKDLIVGIDPATGEVTTTVDASALPIDRSLLGRGEVLNGIAHDPATGRFLVTGKHWPVLYEVEFAPN